MINYLKDWFYKKLIFFLNKNVKKKNNNIVSKVNLAKRVIFIVPRNTTLALPT